MSYWAPGMGFIPFVKKYFSIILIISVLAITAGIFSGYTTYILSRQAAPEEVINATLCSENLANCIVTLGSCEENITECETIRENLEQLSLLADELQDKVYALQQSNIDLQSQVDEYKSKIDEYLEQIDDLNSDLDSAEVSIEELNNSVNSLESQLEILQTEHDAIVQNAADRICCVQKVYNPDLKYYYLSEFEIICTSEIDEELGTKEFNC
jgi:peptidoglycan hydrolase CwlO-like protein